MHLGWQGPRSRLQGHDTCQVLIPPIKLNNVISKQFSFLGRIFQSVLRLQILPLVLTLTLILNTTMNLTITNSDKVANIWSKMRRQVKSQDVNSPVTDSNCF